MVSDSCQDSEDEVFQRETPVMERGQTKNGISQIRNPMRPSFLPILATVLLAFIANGAARAQYLPAELDTTLQEINVGSGAGLIRSPMVRSIPRVIGSAVRSP